MLFGELSVLFCSGMAIGDQRSTETWEERSEMCGIRVVFGSNHASNGSLRKNITLSAYY